MKDWHPHRIATLFGEVRLKLPRFLCAGVAISHGTGWNICSLVQRFQC